MNDPTYPLRQSVNAERVADIATALAVADVRCYLRTTPAILDHDRLDARAALYVAAARAIVAHARTPEGS